METVPGNASIDGRQQDQKRPVTGEQSTPFRTSAMNLKRCLRRAFTHDENVGVPDIPDAGQPVIRTCMEELGARLVQFGIAEPNHVMVKPLSS